MRILQVGQKKLEKLEKEFTSGQERSVRKMMSKNKKVINSFKVGDLVLFKTDDVDTQVADALHNYRDEK